MEQGSKEKEKEEMNGKDKEREGGKKENTLQ